MSTTHSARMSGTKKRIKTPSAKQDSQVATTPLAPQAVVWHRSAPSDVAQAGFWGHESPGWKAWSRYLSRRKTRDMAKLFRMRKGSPLAWVRHADDTWAATFALIDGLVQRSGRSQRRQQESDAEVRAWMLESDPQPAPAAYAMECLAWAYALPQLSQRLSAEAWWELLDCLLHAIHLASEPAVEKDAYARLLLSGELPVVLAYQLPELRTPRRLRDGARQVVSQTLLGTTVPGGWWLAGHTEDIWALVASLLRCRRLLGELKRTWDEPAERRFQELLLNACRFSRPDGTLPLVDVSPTSATPGLAAAIDDALDCQAARQAVSCYLQKLSGPKRPTATPRKLSAASHAEEAGLAVLRTDWSAAADRVTVDFSGAMPEVEVATGSQTLLCGAWHVGVQVDGRPVHAAGPWEVLCWHSDKDVDYLELEADYEDELIVGRHILLAKRDRLLLLADSVIGRLGHRVAYRGDLSLAAGTQFVAEAETREGRLLCRKREAVVFPLALPEWRSDRRVGELQCHGRQLTLEQEGLGRRLFAPLLVDLDSGRSKRQRTWRQLTVAQDREILPTEAAAAFRVQVGDQQWLVYRSLTGRANRTVLGLNLMTEFLTAQFTRRGRAKQLLEIA